VVVDLVVVLGRPRLSPSPRQRGDLRRERDVHEVIVVARQRDANAAPPSASAR
jgi:hypothetical protein